jgi:hypothetical protein
MIFLLSALAILFVARFVFGMAKGLVLMGLVCCMLFDQAQIHPEFGRALWQAVTVTAERLSEFGRDRQSKEGAFSDRYSNDRYSTARPRTTEYLDRSV